MTDSSFAASQDVDSSPTDASVASTSAADPASSLRAAALLTLKSKRRKPQPEVSTSTLPTRPPPETTFQLDYGQDDTSSVPRDTPVVVIAEPLQLSSANDPQAREEGEISDEESVPPPPALHPKRRSSSLTPPPDISSRTPRHRTPSPPVTPPPDSLHSKRTLSERLSDPPIVADSAVKQVQVSSHMPVDAAPAPADPYHVLDVDHVRPGVALNQAQYDRAKDVVLDLLGWGVHPEYLVDCGLTREIIYYVFSELNLRLPQTLDITGLIPFSPDAALLRERQQSSMMPPPPPPQTEQIPIGPPGTTSQLSTEMSPSTATPPPLPSQTVSPPTNPIASESPKPIVTRNLHDIEQQRRQELLARKAAIASKKPKTSAPVASSPSPVASASSSLHAQANQDVDIAVPTATVDDFLKSIGPSPVHSGSTVGMSTVSTSQDQQPNIEEMDIDEIPGLGGAKHFKEIAPVPFSATSRPPHSDTTTPMSLTQLTSGQMSPGDYLPSSTESASTTFSHPTSSAYTSFSKTLAPEEPAFQRRGVKRPVAADFVDFENGSRTPNNGNSDYVNGVYPGHKRRAATGFANIASTRRFIIDLSDSEGEGDVDTVMREAVLSETSTWRGYVSPVPTRPSIPGLNASIGWATPPISIATPTLSVNTAPSSTMSPAALVEKELEIQKMREMIAERERRLNKSKANTETVVKVDNIPVNSNGEATIAATLPGITSGSQLESFEPTLEEHLWPANERSVGPSLGSSHVSCSSGSSAPVPDTPPIGNITRNGTSAPFSAVAEQQAMDVDAQHVAISDNVMRASANGSVDVDLAPPTSTQIPMTTPTPPKLVENQALLANSVLIQEQHDQDYSPYNSPFQWYPLLASGARRTPYTDSTPELNLLSLFPSFASSNSLTIPSFSSVSSFAPTSTSSSATSLSVSVSEPPVASASVNPFYTVTTFTLPNLEPLKLASASKILDPAKRICQYEVPGGGVCRDGGCEDVHLNRIAGLDGCGGVEPSDPDTAEYLLKTLPSDWLDKHGVSQTKLVSALHQVRVQNPQMAFEERVGHGLAALGPPLAR